MSKLDRRSFFHRSSQLLAGAALAGGLPGGAASAIDPIGRKHGSKFKFSLAAYSYRRLLQAKENGLTLSDFISDCARFQLEGTELTSYYFPEQPTAAYLRQLKHECFLAGLGISGTAVRNDFGLPPSNPERQKWIDHVKQWVDYSEILGAPVIRVFAGHVPKGADPAATHKLIVEGMAECCQYAGEHGVHLALENHGGPTATAKGLLAIVKDVQSPWFGVNLDTGNFHSDTPYEELEEVAPYALNVQVKVVTSNAKREKQPADFPRLAKILKDADYRGYVVLEYEEAGNPRTECPQVLEKLRAAFA